MSDIFDLTNILLLAVAVVIFLRLRSVLGRRTGNERPRLDPYAARDAATPNERDNNVITLPRADTRAPAAEAPGSSIDERIGSLPPESRALEPLRAIAAADPKFETDAFLKGAKAAYETIVTAYAHGDRDTLRNLLAPEVYDSFSSIINEREARGEMAEFSFVGIASASIIDASLEGRMAHVTVRFVSELVTAVRDRAGNVVEGDLKAVRQVTDVWTYARDVKSPNPNWRLVATDSPEG
ncbi:MAG: Tim44 domain-containing protein [Rhodomicrobium sp.]|nr:Tim44 domain-containing protein [Rhodomicrobium sp.]